MSARGGQEPAQSVTLPNQAKFDAGAYLRAKFDAGANNALCWARAQLARLQSNDDEAQLRNDDDDDDANAAKPGAVPMSIHQRRGYAAEYCHRTPDSPGLVGLCGELLTTGNRIWGNWLIPASKLLRVKVYSFGLYCDAGRLKAELKPFAGRTPRSLRRDPSFFAALLAAGPSLRLTLLVRPSRDLPIRLMQAEYRRILRRRLVKVGGSGDDPGLLEVMNWFCESSPLPWVSRGHVLANTPLAFSWGAAGELSVKAGESVLGVVRSPRLCAALFDLYLGTEPVSREAKMRLAETAARVLAGEG